MSLVMQEEPGTKFLEIKLTGKLSKSDYEQFAPKVEELMHENGHVRLLVTMEGFGGWTMGGLWEDVKFDVKHFRDIERIAFVGEKRWEEGMSKFCKPFTSAEIRFFYPEKTDDARSWLNSP